MSSAAERVPEPAENGVPVGVPVMDAEHGIQFQLLRMLQEAIRRHDGRGAIVDLVGQYIDYTGVHFLSEQILMRLHSYPGYSEHVLAHDRFLRDVRSLRDAVASEQVAVGEELVASLHDRLVAHIETMDRPLGAYLANP